MKKLLHWIEAFFTVVAYILLRLLPLSVASALGGFMARHLGPHTKVHKVAIYNLNMAIPELSETESTDILRRMWDNLGRVFAEYPHLNSRAMRSRIHTIHGLEHMLSFKDKHKPLLMVSGHIGNWELLGLAAYHQGMPMHLLYRAANNPVADKVVGWMRKPFSLGLHSKGKQGARAVIKAMQAHEPIGMLIDQKTNDGIECTFFGHTAMTSPAVAECLARYQPEVVPAFCRRTKGANFEFDVLPPIHFTSCGNSADEIQAITQQINDVLEGYIRRDPAQWFWVHKRWPHSKIYSHSINQQKAA